VFVLALIPAILLIPGHPPGGVGDGRPVLGNDENQVECNTYCRLLRQAADLAAVNAHPIDSPTYRKLYSEPDRFRCQLVGVQGTLKRVTVYNAPDFLRMRTGLKTLYEAWLSVPPTGEPLCIVLPHWPDGLPHSGPMDVPVAAAGYFFKRYRYESPDGWRDAPLLIGGVISPRVVAEPASVFGGRAALPCAAVAIALAMLRLWLWIDDRSHRRLSHGVKVRG
jgi:hypothetical protein